MRRGMSVLVGIGLAVSMQAQITDGAWKGILKVGPQKLNVVFNFKKAADGALQCTMDSPDQGAKGIPATVKMFGADSLNVEIPMLKVRYDGKLRGKEIIGTFNQAGMAFDLNLTPGQVVRNRPQTPVAPFTYKTEEVSFTNEKDQSVLSGTLTYPEGYEGMNKKEVPVVLMISGSGPQNRDEELFDHKPFGVIADYLAKNGIASLRYDDRGVGKSKGNTKDLTTEGNMRDAAAGIGYLKKLNKFGKTGVLGHSEGGTIAFMLGEAGKADFIVSMAGTAVKGDQVLIEQNRKLLGSTGLSEQQTDDYCKVLKEIFKYKETHKDIVNPQEVIAEMIRRMNVSVPDHAKANLVNVLGTKTPWIDYFVSLDPSKSIAKTKCPVFALNGAKDVQVIADSNLGAIRKLLPENKANQIKLYPNLNHLFQNCQNGSIAEYVNIEQTISPEVLKDIAAWINLNAK